MILRPHLRRLGQRNSLSVAQSEEKYLRSDEEQDPSHNHGRVALRLARQNDQLVSRYCVQRRLVDIEVSHHKLGWGVGQPLRKREVLIEAALEHLQKHQVCVPCIFDVMQEVFSTYPTSPV